MSRSIGTRRRLFSERTRRLLVVDTAKILLLEDDDVLRSLIVDTLVDENYYVSDAATPEQAVEMFSRDDYDLFITDVRMAGFTDGLGVLSELKRKRPSLRSVVITGFTDLQSPAQAMQCQADDYLFKGDQGFGIDRLLDVVQRVLQVKAPSTNWFQSIAHRTGSLLQFSWLKIQHKLLSQLESSRQSCLKIFYLGICSGHLSEESSRQKWMVLLGLESSCNSLEPSNTKQILWLAEAFEALSQSLIEGSAPPAMSYSNPEHSLSYRKVHHCVRQKQLAFAEFACLARLSIEPSHRNHSAYHFALYQMLSGLESEQKESSPGSQFVLPGFGPLRELESWGTRECFRATSLDHTGSRVVEHLTAEELQAEQRALEVCQPSSLAGIQIFDEQQQLLVRPWDDWAPTLAREVARGPLSLQASLQIIQPIWQVIGRLHQAGLADGFLSPDRLVWHDGQYCLRSFGATNFYQLSKQIDYSDSDGLSAPFSLWHCDLTNLEQAAPGPLNDQFSLGIILAQLLTGSSDPLALIWSRYDHDSGQLLGLDIGGPEKRLNGLLARMLCLEPAQRFPDLKSAWEALAELTVKQGA
jgi:DNA-binding NarL/FixJ family response regulator